MPRVRMQAWAVHLQVTGWWAFLCCSTALGDVCNVAVYHTPARSGYLRLAAVSTCVQT